MLYSSHFILDIQKMISPRPLAFGKDMRLLLTNGITFEPKNKREPVRSLCAYYLL